ncbi:winged helix-turn-helix domain-containing protein [Chryseobacterium indologenes]|uniref:helix-turn-helix domain-containing protein n=1 Tax=Chryseobacterium indologenes TaxID=253 RepID=UPI001108133F|nr:helix-turn-helix domain-containing protein [Chryseobacterium indologenes]TLX25178.1 winged helix-turn-helix domain-containing protein [Chryseobacterium indologenes]
MYYLELIQRFWDFNKIVKISPTEIALYLYLLKIGYEKDRYDFKISDVELARELGLTRVTIKASKDKLKNRGLIQFQTSNGLPCYYRLLLDYSFEIKPEKEGIKKDSDTENLQKRAILEIPQIIDNLANESTIIPSWEEFISYAKTLQSYDSPMYFSIEKKYKIWVDKGWKNAFNRPISNWKATLKSTLPYMNNSSEDNPISLKDIPNIKRP